MLIFVWLIYTSFGTMTRSLGPLVTPIVKDLHLTYGEMGSILGSWQLVYIPASVIAGIAIDRFGLRASIGVGTLIMALSGSLRVGAVSYETMFAAVAVFGLGGSLISIGAPKLVSVWFEGRDRNRAAGFYATASPVGGILAFSSINSLLLPRFGSWRMVLLFFTLIVLALSILWWVFAKDASYNKVNSKQPRRLELSFGRSLMAVAALRNVWLVVIVGLPNFLLIHAMNSWLPRIIETSGMSPEQAGYLASLPALVGIPASLLIARYAPEEQRRYVVSGLLGCSAIALLAVGSLAGSPLLISLMFLGLGSGAMLPLLMLILMNTREVQSELMGSAVGLYFTVGEIGGFAGPYLVGTIFDVTGSFFPGLMLISLVTLIAIPLTFLVRE